MIRKTLLFIKYGKSKPAEKPLSADEEQIGFQIKIWGKATNSGLRDFMKWCDENQYQFSKK